MVSKSVLNQPHQFWYQRCCLADNSTLWRHYLINICSTQNWSNHKSGYRFTVEHWLVYFYKQSQNNRNRVCHPTSKASNFYIHCHSSSPIIHQRASSMPAIWCSGKLHSFPLGRHQKKISFFRTFFPKLGAGEGQES